MTSAPAPRSLPSEGVYRRLTEFIAFLRGRGLPIGIGAEVDLGRALGILPIWDRGAFHQACRAILARSPEELERLDRAFELFWSPGVTRPGIPSPGRSTASTLSRPPGGTPPQDREPEGARLDPPAGVTRFGTYSAKAPAPGHALTPLTPRELLVLRRGARGFRRLTATLPGRRFARARRGTVDFPETLRRSMSQGGEWVELARQNRQNRRAELVILWDVSGSMREHDARCFALVYALVRVSRGSRVFAFSTTVREITDDIRRDGYRRAAVVVAARIADTEGGTQIGPCLRQFSERHGSAVRDRSAVVVVSDGWDLAESTTVAEELRRIRRRAHLVVWISPYACRPGFEPKTGGLLAALPHTDVLLGPEDFESRFPLRPRSWKQERSGQASGLVVRAP